MELPQHQQCLFEEWMMAAPQMEATFSNELLSESWNFTSFDQPRDVIFPLTDPSLLGLISLPDCNYPYPFGEFHPFLDAPTPPEYGSFDLLLPMAMQEEYAANMGNVQVGILDNQMNHAQDGLSGYVVEGSHTDATNMGIANVGLHGDNRSKRKKPDGQPSKNLMAERRRRKRLNDRLSMLRSIVPNISKMDRTSILGDTIDYLRDLHEKIQKLREKCLNENIQPIDLTGTRFKEAIARSPPKIEVERQNQDIRIDVCSTAKPGLLLSTLSTLDALGLEIQQCVISCFNDFSFQASCHEGAEQGSLASCEDVKQALSSNAGFGGRFQYNYLSQQTSTEYQEDY